jgi:hypothetical protein
MQDFGSQLADRVSTDHGREKMAALSGKIIFDKLREVSFARPILDAQPIGPEDCQISENSDTFTRLEWLEPQSRALIINFRGDSTAQELRADRAFMSFFTVASQVFTKTEQELQIYRSIPVSQLIEQNTLKDMQEVQDHSFLRYCERAVQAMQTEANNGTVTTLNATALQGATPPVEHAIVKGESARNALADNGTVYALQKPDIAMLQRLLSSNRLEGAVLLLTRPDMDMVGAWTLEDFGSQLLQETTKEGYKYNKLLGLKIITSIKTDILRPGNGYLFTAPQFLGRFYILNKTKFYVDKRFNRISWQAWEDLGMLLLNVNSVKKLELYSGDTSANDADGLLAAGTVSPFAIKDLGGKNNRVAEGIRYPEVSSF